MCFVSFRVFYVTSIIWKTLLYKINVFNKYKSYIIFLYYIRFYCINIILIKKKFFYLFYFYLFLFILFCFINIIYYIFIFISKTHLLNAFLYKMNLKYFFRYCTYVFNHYAYVHKIEIRLRIEKWDWKIEVWPIRIKGVKTSLSSLMKFQSLIFNLNLQCIVWFRPNISQSYYLLRWGKWSMLLIDPWINALTRRKHLIAILVPVTRMYWSMLGMLKHATRQTYCVRLVVRKSGQTWVSWVRAVIIHTKLNFFLICKRKVW